MSPNRSNWPVDKQLENKLGQFMDENFYQNLIKKNPNCQFESFRNYDKETDREKQHSGIDIEVTDKKTGQVIFIDEKASLYYSNTLLPTFAFEIDFINEKDQLVPGWFVKDDLATTHYLCIWPNVKCFKKGNYFVRPNIKIDEIDKWIFTTVEAMLIKKIDLRNFLMTEYKLSSESLSQYALQLRQEHPYHPEIEKENIRYLIDDNLLYLKLSYNKKEKPINLVIKKEILKSVALRVYLISSDGFAQIK